MSLEVPDRIREEQRMPAKIRANVRMMSPVFVHAECAGQETPQKKLSRGEVLLRKNYALALARVGGMRNAFALRGMRCVRDEGVFPTIDRNDDGNITLRAPSDVSLDDLEALLHGQVTDALLLLQKEHHPRADEMWEIDTQTLQGAWDHAITKNHDALPVSRARIARDLHRDLA